MNPQIETDFETRQARQLERPQQQTPPATSPHIADVDQPSNELHSPDNSGPKRWAENAKEALHDAKVKAGEGKDRVSRYLEEHDLRAEAREVTREHPAAVLGSLVALGFVIGLAIRPSSSHSC